MQQGFHVFLANLMHIFLYKGLNCPFVLGDIEKIPFRAQWVSGRVLDSRPKSRGFEPHCVVSLSKSH